jgi:hypothetical protein
MFVVYLMLVSTNHHLQYNDFHLLIIIHKFQLVLEFVVMMEQKYLMLLVVVIQHQLHFYLLMMMMKYCL